MSSEENCRIVKFISNSGYCSRRQAGEFVKAGKVTVNGEVIQDMSLSVKSSDNISIDGQKIKHSSNTDVYIYSKPREVIVSASDEKDRDVIYDKLPDYLSSFVYVGRLDYNSEGLLLLTNNRSLAHYLQQSQNGVERVYKVRVFGKLNRHLIDKINNATITVNDINYRVLSSYILSSSKKLNHEIIMALDEGKNREIRNIVNDYLGMKVSRLTRISYGKFKLDNLKSGEFVKADKKIVNFYVRKMEAENG